MHRQKSEWEDIYQSKSTPWDVGKPEPYLVEFLEKENIKPCDAIDLGCGTGNEAIFLAKKGFNVTGVDISQAAIKEAEKKSKDARLNVKFIVSDIAKLKLKKKVDFAFDRACFHFIDPVDRSKYIQLVAKCLNPGAIFLLIISSEHETAKGPYQFAKEDIKNLFSKYFEILSIRLVTLKTHLARPRPYLCVLKRKP